MSTPIRLVYLLSALIPGGAERLVHSLVQHLNRKRIEVHIVALGSLRGNPFKAEFDRLGLPINVLGATKMYHPMVYTGLRRYLIENHIDMMHTHLINPDYIGRIVGRSLGIPVISTMHNVPEDYEREVFYRSWPERATARYLATHLIAVSERIRQMYIKRWGIPQHKITTINNGVPMEHFLSVPSGVPAHEPGQGPLITTIGRLTDQKAQNVLLDAARIVLNLRPDVRFMIVGQGKLEQQLKDQASALGIDKQVDFAGIRYDIPAILGKSTLFVLSSAWEGMPVSAIEAMAAARAVVLTDVGGVRDLVGPEVSGLLVPPQNPSALAQALIELLNDEPRRLAMGEAGRAQVRNEFTMDLFANRHEALYTSILSAHKMKLHQRNAFSR